MELLAITVDLATKKLKENIVNNIRQHKKTASKKAKQLESLDKSIRSTPPASSSEVRYLQSIKLI